MFRIIIILFFVFYTILGLSHIGIDSDVLSLFSPHLKSVQGLSLFLKFFSQKNELIITFNNPNSTFLNHEYQKLIDFFAKNPQLGRIVPSLVFHDFNTSSEILAYSIIHQSPEEIKKLVSSILPKSADQRLQESLAILHSSFSPQELFLTNLDPYRIINSCFSDISLSSIQFLNPSCPILKIEPFDNIITYSAKIKWLESIKKICRNTLNPSIHVRFTGEIVFLTENASSMQRDMLLSSITTLILIGIIFFVVYRRIIPLIVLLILLFLIFLLTLATAGLIFHHISVIGAGFASVMIGLSVDYGYFIYQKSLNLNGNLLQVRRESSKNILWTSGTTSLLFFSLNWMGIPGLAEFGNIVGIGVLIGVTVMLLIFAPVVCKIHRKNCTILAEKKMGFDIIKLFNSEHFFRWGEKITFLLVIVLMIALIWKGFPKTDFSSASLRSKSSQAQEVYDMLHPDTNHSVYIMIKSKNEEDMLQQLQQLECQLKALKNSEKISNFFLPLLFIPHRAWEQQNLKKLDLLIQRKNYLQKTLLINGFNQQSFLLTNMIFNQWQKWQNQKLAISPKNVMSRSILKSFLYQENGLYLGLGIIEPTQLFNRNDCGGNIYFVDWKFLGNELKESIVQHVLIIGCILAIILFFLLLIAFKNWKTVLIFFLTTALIFIALIGAITVLNIKIGFFTLVAFLLLLGTGTDYSILLLLLLKSANKNMKDRCQLSLIICLCASSAIIGFGSLILADNQGLSMLGKTSSLGLLLDMLISIFLLPRIYNFFHNQKLKY